MSSPYTGSRTSISVVYCIIVELTEIKRCLLVRVQGKISILVRWEHPSNMTTKSICWWRNFRYLVRPPLFQWSLARPSLQEHLSRLSLAQHMLQAFSMVSAVKIHTWRHKCQVVLSYNRSHPWISPKSSNTTTNASSPRIFRSEKNSYDAFLL